MSCNKMWARIVVASTLAGASLASSAGTQGGIITYMDVRDRDGLIYFELDGTRGGKPACAAGNYWMIRDEKSATGARQFAVLLAAQMSGKAVLVTGSNTCTRWSDGEDVDTLRSIP